MGVIEPKGRRGRMYFGCGAAACLGLVFWALIACCLVLVVAGMILAAVLPTLVLEYPGAIVWLKAGGVLIGGAYLLYGMLMLWLTLAAYESYRHTDEGEMP